MQSLRGPETALQDKHSCTAPAASGKAWCLARMDRGNHKPLLLQIRLKVSGSSKRYCCFVNFVMVVPTTYSFTTFTVSAFNSVIITVIIRYCVANIIVYIDDNHCVSWHLGGRIRLL